MKKSKHHINIESKRKSLSILIHTDGFSFCINDIDTNKTISFSKYEFKETINSLEMLLNTILKIFGTDNDLHHDFLKFEIIHQNRLSTLVPDAFFDESKLKAYLNLNIKTLPEDYITYDTIEFAQAKNIYVPYVNINNYFFQNFGEFEYKHHSTVLIEKLISYAFNNSLREFFVYVSKKQLDVIVIKNNRLVLYNSFEYNSPNDFIYYILFVAEQLEMNPNDFILTFIGDINTDDENYAICYSYIRNIEFITTNSDFFACSDTFLNHFNYILIS